MTEIMQQKLKNDKRTENFPWLFGIKTQFYLENGLKSIIKKFIPGKKSFKFCDKSNKKLDILFYFISRNNQFISCYIVSK